MANLRVLPKKVCVGGVFMRLVSRQRIDSLSPQSCLLLLHIAELAFEFALLLTPQGTVDRLAGAPTLGPGLPFDGVEELKVCVRVRLRRARFRFFPFSPIEERGGL